MRVQLAHHVIEPLAGRHLDAFVRYRQVPEIARYQGWSPGYSRADARALLVAQSGCEFPAPGHWVQYGIVSTSTGELDGDVAVHTLEEQPDTYELGVTLAPHGQGRGIATQALRSVLENLFGERAAHRVIATIDHRNDPARRALGRVGFRHEGTFVDADWLKDEWTTTERWATLQAPTPPEPPR